MLLTDQPTVIPPYGARHIDAGFLTACGIPLNRSAVRFPAVENQRISCQACADKS